MTVCVCNACSSTEMLGQGRGRGADRVDGETVGGVRPCCHVSSWSSPLSAGMGRSGVSWTHQAGSASDRVPSRWYLVLPLWSCEVPGWLEFLSIHPQGSERAPDPARHGTRMLFHSLPRTRRPSVCPWGLGSFYTLGNEKLLCWGGGSMVKESSSDLEDAVLTFNICF